MYPRSCGPPACNGVLYCSPEAQRQPFARWPHQGSFQPPVFRGTPVRAGLDPVFKFAKTSPGAPDKNDRGLTEHFDPADIPRVLYLVHEPVGDDIAHLGGFSPVEGAVPIATQNILDIHIDPHGRDVGTSTGEGEPMAVVAPRRWPQFDRAGEHEAALLPGQCDGPCRRIVANPGQDPGAVAGKDGEGNILDHAGVQGSCSSWVFPLDWVGTSRLTHGARWPSWRGARGSARTRRRGAEDPAGAGPGASEIPASPG